MNHPQTQVRIKTLYSPKPKYFVGPATHMVKITIDHPLKLLYNHFIKQPKLLLKQSYILCVVTV